MQSTICLELHNKVINSSPERCNGDCKRERMWNAIANTLKSRLKGANECKTWPNKNWKYGWECKRKVINVFQVRLMIQFRVYLIIHLQLYLKVIFNIYIHVFYKKNFYKKMGLKNLQNLNKMLRKSLALNPWAGIFKNADFC